MSFEVQGVYVGAVQLHPEKFEPNRKVFVELKMTYPEKLVEGELVNQLAEAIRTVILPYEQRLLNPKLAVNATDDNLRYLLCMQKSKNGAHIKVL